MRNLIRRALRPVSRDDSGAIGMLVGVLIASGVLFGMTAVVVDVGGIYAERSQLQNGADAGALAMAKACAKGTEDCTDSTEADGTAGRYANRNSRDDVSNVDLVCGFDNDSLLLPCPPSTGAKTACPVETPDGEYVDVYTSTLTDENSTLLPPSFAHTLTGTEYSDGVTVGACARAAWGPPGSGGETIPLTISTCEWQEATADGTDYAPSPPYPPDPDPSYSKILRLHDPQQDSSTSGNDGDNCTDDKAVDGPGMFGWIDDPDKDCSAEFEGDTYGSDPGANISNECKTALKDARDNHTPIFIPVYSDVNGTGNNGEYTWDGWAAFIITGYHLPGFKAPDWLNNTNKCKGEEKCIFGFFIDEELMPGGGSIGGPDRGVYVIKLTG